MTGDQNRLERTVSEGSAAGKANATRPAPAPAGFHRPQGALPGFQARSFLPAPPERPPARLPAHLEPRWLAPGRSDGKGEATCHGGGEKTAFCGVRGQEWRRAGKMNGGRPGAGVRGSWGRSSSSLSLTYHVHKETDLVSEGNTRGWHTAGQPNFHKR